MRRRTSSQGSMRGECLPTRPLSAMLILTCFLDSRKICGRRLQRKCNCHGGPPKQCTGRLAKLKWQAVPTYPSSTWQTHLRSHHRNLRPNHSSTATSLHQHRLLSPIVQAMVLPLQLPLHIWPKERFHRLIITSSHTCRNQFPRARTGQDETAVRLWLGPRAGTEQIVPAILSTHQPATA